MLMPNVRIRAGYLDTTCIGREVRFCPPDRPMKSILNYGTSGAEARVERNYSQRLSYQRIRHRAKIRVDGRCVEPPGASSAAARLAEGRPVGVDIEGACHRFCRAGTFELPFNGRFVEPYYLLPDSRTPALLQSRNPALPQSNCHKISRSSLRAWLGILITSLGPHCVHG